MATKRKQKSSPSKKKPAARRAPAKQAAPASAPAAAAATAAPVDLPARDSALRRLVEGFLRDLPADAHTGGRYGVREGDRFHGIELPIPDGTYRLLGSEWLFTFQGGRFVEASRAAAPDYGGADVIQI